MKYELYVKDDDVYVIYGDSFGRIYDHGSLPSKYKTLEQFVWFLSHFGKVKCTPIPENCKEERELAELFKLRLF